LDPRASDFRAVMNPRRLLLTAYSLYPHSALEHAKSVAFVFFSVISAPQRGQFFCTGLFQKI
jgi:hypothetical protein